jgi:uncharacterized membrane protein
MSTDHASDTPHGLHDHDSLASRVSAIEARLSRLEAGMGVTPPPLPAMPVAPPVAAASPVLEARPPVASPPSLPNRLPPAAQPPVTRLDESLLETAVGGRWYAVAGAVIVMIGMGLGLKFAYDQGWMRHVTPSMRCVAAASFGAALVLAGWNRRRHVGDWAAAAIIAAGVGSLYGSAWAAYGLYELVGNAAAFLLLVAVAIGGILVSAKSGLVAVGVLSIIGGLLAPVIAGDGPSPPWIMASHLLAIMTIGSAVAAWKQGRFAALRSIAWWGVVLLGTSWAGSVDLWRSHPFIALAFPAIFWAIVHGGMWLEFRGDARSDADEVPTDAPSPRSAIEAAARPSARAMVSSFSTTLWCAWMGIYAGSVSGAVEPWIVCLAYAAACGVLSQPLAGTLMLLRDVPRTDRERLGASLLLQVGGLIIAAIGFGLGGMSQTIAWLGLGLAAVVAGRAIRTTRLDTYGLVLLAIGLFRLMRQGLSIHFATLRPGVGGPATLELAGLHLGEWSALVFGAGVAWLLAARLTQLNREPRRNLHAIIAAAMGTLALLATPMTPGSSELAVAAWAACVAFAGLALAAPMGSAARMPLMATGAVAVACGWWSAACLTTWTDGEWARTSLHPGLAVGFVVVTAAAATTWTNARRTDDESGPFAATMSGLLGSVVFLAATTLEVARVSEIVTQDETSRRAAVSIWWATLSIGLLVIGFARRWRWPRYVGLGLMGIAAIKALSYDLAGIGQGWRVISVLGVGLMMLAVAVLYGKLAARLDAPTDPPAPD